MGTEGGGTARKETQDARVGRGARREKMQFVVGAMRRKGFDKRPRIVAQACKVMECSFRIKAYFHGQFKNFYKLITFFGVTIKP